jgi:tRNA pseudouridine55 synthase
MKDGVLLVYKPKGPTSHDVVGVVRKTLGFREVGHAGTLDPMAEGLLVLLLGEATKLSDFILNGDKTYRARVQLGIETDSWDLDGTVIAGASDLECPQFLPAEVAKASQTLVGEFKWPAPAFSAVKVAGKKLYEYAREGQAVPTSERTMIFRSVQFLSYDPKTAQVDVEISCSKGSFIRSWAYELGRVLGTKAALSGLVRLRSEPFSVQEAVTLDALTEGTPIIPLNECLPSVPGYSLKGRDLRLMINGQVPHELERRLVPLQRAVNEGGVGSLIRVIDGETMNLCAVLEMQARSPLRLKRVFKPVLTRKNP